MSNTTGVSSSIETTRGEPLAGPHFPMPQPTRTLAANKPRGACCLRATELRKSFRKGQTSIPVLKGVDIEIREREFLSVVGKSGSGKSTLLHLLATLDAPDAGEIYFNQERIDNLGALRRDRLRNTKFGIVFQFYHLLPELTTLENVLLPSMIQLTTWRYLAARRQLKRRARDLVDRVGLGHRLKHRPAELSGGEMQRVAIARALMNQPELLLADEPTGNLDHQTGAEIMQLLESLNTDQKLTIVMVTHDMALANKTHRVVHLEEGCVRQR